ncbi:MAG: shikimate kinase [Vicinamibacteria bacterium]
MATELYFLIGFMGAGKTTLGRGVAERMNLAFRDLDELIERSSGKSVAEIFSLEGEEGFRRLESQALQDLIAEGEQAVVATGGGAFTVETNRRLMKDAGVVVWIDVPVDEIRHRIDAGSRPLWTTPEEVDRLHERRENFYRAAHHHLRLSNNDPEDAVERLHRLLLGCRKFS